MNDYFPIKENNIFSNPALINNYTVLQDSGILKYIETLNKQIFNYREIVSGAINLFNGQNMDEIFSSAMKILSDRYLPDFVYFIIKPVKHDEIPFIRGYRNYRRIPDDEQDFAALKDFNKFEDFFLNVPKPLLFGEEGVPPTIFGDAETEKADTSLFLDVFGKLKPQLIVPIMGRSMFYGMMLLGGKILEQHYTEPEIQFINNYVSFLSQAIQNNFNYEGTLRDSKTGLFNLHYFMTRLNEEIARIKRSNDLSSVIMLDIDHFKNFNDDYGHLAGDYVLECISSVLKRSVRRQDIPARFGGEEFVLLLPNADRRMAWTAAERLRITIANMDMEQSPRLPNVTVSLGVFTINGRMDISAKEVIDRTDKALYQSKEAGRNRTTMSVTGFLDKLNHAAAAARK